MCILPGVQGDDVPQQALYTDTWRFVIPAVYARCPSCPMALNASVTAAPRTTFDPARGIISSGAQWDRFPALSSDARQRVRGRGDILATPALPVLFHQWIFFPYFTAGPAVEACLIPKGDPMGWSWTAVEACLILKGDTMGWSWIL